MSRSYLDKKGVVVLSTSLSIVDDDFVSSVSIGRCESRVIGSILFSPTPGSPRRPSSSRGCQMQHHPPLAGATAVADRYMGATNDSATIQAAAEQAMALARAAALAAKEAAALAERDPYLTSRRLIPGGKILSKKSPVSHSRSYGGIEEFMNRETESLVPSESSDKDEKLLWGADEDRRLTGLGIALQQAQESLLDKELEVIGGEGSILIPFGDDFADEGRRHVLVRSKRKVERVKRAKKIGEKRAAAAQGQKIVDRKVQAEGEARAKSDTGTSSEVDPMRTFLSKSGVSKLLTAKEEIELSKKVQDLLQLEKVRDALAEEMGRLPTSREWADALDISTGQLDQRLHEGKQSMGRMVSSNMRLVVSVAQKYLVRGMNIEDLITEGCMGLIRGVHKFDYRKGFKFSTYAHWWIRQSITRTVAEQTRIVRLPLHLFESVSRINKARRMLTDELGRAPDNDEVAELVGMSKSKMMTVVKSIRAPTSMDKPFKNSDGEETLGDLVADQNLPSQDDQIMRNFLRKDIENALHTLTPRERDVMKLRYGLNDGRMKTLEEVGVAFRVTRERIRQIEIKALRKLRNPQRSSNLQHYIADEL